MCPACITTLALMAAGATSTRGLTALVVRHLRANETGPNHDLRPRRPGWEGYRPDATRGSVAGSPHAASLLLRAAPGEMPIKRLKARLTAAPLPRTHMLLRVEADSGPWLADVGFGGDGPLLPVPLDGGLSEQPEGAYRVEREPGDVYVLRRRWRGAWNDLYAFTLRPALPVDFELAHHYTATHPHSIFVRMLTVQRSQPGARQILRGRLYTVRQGDAETVREAQDADLPALLKERFGLELPEDDVLRALGRPGSPGDRQR